VALQAPSLLNMSFLPTASRPAAPRQDNQSADILNALMLAGLMSEADDYRSGLNALTQPDAPGVNPLGVSTGGVDDPRYVPAQTDKYGMPLGLAAQTMTRDDAPLIGGMTEAQLYDLLPPDAPRGGQFYMEGTEIKYLPPISKPEPENFEGRYDGITALPSMDSYSSMRAPEFVTYSTGRPDPSGFTTDFRDIFREDPNLGPAAKTLGNILSMQSGLGSIPKAGPAIGNILGRGASKLGEGIQNIPLVGGIAKTIGDVANVIAKPIANIVEDSAGPMGVLGGLIKNRPGILFPKTPEQPASTPTLNFVPPQKIDPSVMNTRQDIEALLDSFNPDGSGGVLSGSSPFASSYVPNIGDEIVIGRQDSSLRNLPNQPGTVESATIDPVERALGIDFDQYQNINTDVVPQRIRDAQRQERAAQRQKRAAQTEKVLSNVAKAQERMGPSSGFYARSTGAIDRANAPLTMTTQGGQQRGYRSSEGLGARGFGGIQGTMLPRASGSWGGDNPFAPGYEPPAPGSPEYGSYLQETLAPDTGALQREIQGMVDRSLPFRQLESKDKYYLQDKESGNIFLSGKLPQGYQRSTYGGISNIGGSI